MSEGAPPARPPLRIRLPFQTEADFLERYRPHVTRSGIFVATKVVRPEGTSLRFEFVLQEGTRLLRGEATVLHVLRDAQGMPAGMTLRFVRLDTASLALLERLAAPTVGAPHPSAAPPQAPPKAPEPGRSPEAGRATNVPGDSHALFAGQRAFIPRRRTLDFDLGSTVVNHRVEELGLGVWWGESTWRAATTFESASSPTPLELGAPHAPASSPESRFSTLADTVRTRHGRLPQRMVLAVPPTFGLGAKRHLLEQAHASGFESVVFAEPASLAALAHAHGQGFTRKRLLVGELGSGGLALVELQGNDVHVSAHGWVAPLHLDSESTWVEQRAAWQTAVTGLMRASARGPSLLDGVVLCGTPDERSALANELPPWLGAEVPSSVLEPSAVEEGAALLAQSQAKALRGKTSAQLSDVLRRPLLLAQPGVFPSVVLEAGRRLPAERAISVRLEPGVPVPLALFEGEDPQALGLVILESAQAGSAAFHLRAQTDGLLSLAAVLPSGRRVELRLESGTLPEAPPQMEAALAAAEPEGERRGVLQTLQRLIRRR